MVEDCHALVWGCQQCRTFAGAIPKAPPCLIQVHALLELFHVDFTSLESTMELNKPPSIKNIVVITDHFTCYALAAVTRDQTAKTVARVLYANFTCTLVEELCAAFGIQKWNTTAYHAQCNGQVEYFHQTLF